MLTKRTTKPFANHRVTSPAYLEHVVSQEISPVSCSVQFAPKALGNVCWSVYKPLFRQLFSIQVACKKQAGFFCSVVLIDVLKSCFGIFGSINARKTFCLTQLRMSYKVPSFLVGASQSETRP